jgi:hypothetical protein
MEVAEDLDDVQIDCWICPNSSGTAHLGLFGDTMDLCNSFGGILGAGSALREKLSRG